MNTRACLLAACLSLGAWSAAQAQTEVAVAPIECWWRTDRGAIRVGEPFQLTLTCAVLDTERARVVVEESSLEPSALHLTPFEIVEGRRFRDVPNAPRRFFQYEYTLRIIGEEFFGRDITLPRLQISYRVQNALQGGSALQGRELQYSLAPVPIRVLSLVPPGATDIRDATPDTFGAVESRLFRSNVLFILGLACLAAAGLLVLLVATRAFLVRKAATPAAPRPASSPALLRAASRELAAVQSAAGGGWTAELMGRAASALRVAGAVALGRPVAEIRVAAGEPPREGQVAAAPLVPWPRRQRRLFSAAVTPSSPAPDEATAALWTPIAGALTAFSRARYAASAADAEASTALDAALADARHAVRQLRTRVWMRLGRRPPAALHTAVRPSWER